MNDDYKEHEDKITALIEKLEAESLSNTLSPFDMDEGTCEAIAGLYSGAIDMCNDYIILCKASYHSGCLDLKAADTMINAYAAMAAISRSYVRESPDIEVAYDNAIRLVSDAWQDVRWIRDAVNTTPSTSNCGDVRYAIEAIIGGWGEYPQTPEAWHDLIDRKTQNIRIGMKATKVCFRLHSTVDILRKEKEEKLKAQGNNTAHIDGDPSQPRRSGLKYREYAKNPNKPYSPCVPYPPVRVAEGAPIPPMPEVFQDWIMGDPERMDLDPVHEEFNWKPDDPHYGEIEIDYDKKLIYGRRKGKPPVVWPFYRKERLDEWPNEDMLMYYERLKNEGATS